MVKILHLSDLHFCTDSQANNMKNILLNEARSIQNLADGEKLLIITGDFHNFWDSDYNCAEKFIDELIETMKIDRTKDVFIIPGNHDDGNDKALDKELGLSDAEWKKKKISSIAMLKNGDMSYLDWRLQSFIPYCQFARRIGVYSYDDDELLPAKVHVRSWRGKLNILHLNTALVADGSKDKGNQRVDVNKATADETWKQWYSDNIPTLALGHNSFYDLEENQQKQLKIMFSQRNVSAYLCGDTHKITLDIQAQIIPLEFGIKSNRLEIPNIVCVKGISDTCDNYSDFGYYWHEWDEKTAHVNLLLRSWRPEFLDETFLDSRGTGGYDMRRKKSTTNLTQSNSQTTLKQYLKNLLLRNRDNHPSFVLLKKDDIDARLFPPVTCDAQFDLIDDTNKNENVSPIWSIIRESWKNTKKRNVVIEGSGGIGKTIALFSVINIHADKIPPSIYIPMHHLIKETGECISVPEYIEKLSKRYSQEILQLADGGWDKGPKLLILLDGFNEVRADKRRIVLRSINEWNDCSGVQFIAVSRPMDGMDLARELIDNPIVISLKPLSRDAVKAYLKDRAPATSDSIWDVLVLPLFLNLYCKTFYLEGFTSYGYKLAYKKAENGGTLVWNYLQREMLREESDDWVIRCTIGCEYILPYIAFSMEQNHLFAIERKRAIALINESLATIDFNKLPRHLEIIINEYESRYFCTPDLTTVNWNNTIFHDLGLLKANGSSYSFIHQIFRDAFAGLYLVNQAEMMKEEIIPPVWRRAPNHYVMDFVADLIDESDTIKLWEANRKIHPTNQFSTYSMLELQRLKSNNTDLHLNFSGMNLRGLSLIRYMRDGGQGEKDIRLFRNAELSDQTILDERTFCSLGHSSWVNCVDISNNGMCISGSNDRTLRLWDLHTCECLGVLEGHTDAVRCVAIKEDGTLCISASDDKSLQVWDLNTGECIRKIKGHTGKINSVTLIDDIYCVSGADDRTLRVCEVHTGKLIRELKGHTDKVNCIAALSGEICVSGSNDKTLRVWNIITGECIHVLKGHTSYVNCVGLTKNGLCVSGADDGTLRIWDFHTGKYIRQLQGHNGAIRSLVILDDAFFICGSDDGTLQIWNLYTGEFSYFIGEHHRAVKCIAIAEDDLCISGSEDNTLKLWDLRTRECIHTIDGLTNRVNCVALKNDDICISGLHNSTLSVWNLQDNKRTQTLEGHNGAVRCVAIVKKDVCISGSDDKTIRVWNSNTGKCIRTMIGHTKAINAVTVLLEKICISCSDDKTIRIWDIQTGKCIRILEGHDNWVRCIAQLDGKCFISGSADKTLRVWDFSTGKCIRIIRGHTDWINCIAVTDEGLCISGSGDKTLRVWNPLTGECLRILEGHTDWVMCVAALRNGLCVSGSADKTLRVWDLNTGKCLRILKGHTHLIRCIATTKDGDCISGSNDGTLRLWDTKTGNCLNVEYSMEVNVSSMDFSNAVITATLAEALRQNGAKVDRNNS